MTLNVDYCDVEKY